MIMRYLPHLEYLNGLPVDRDAIEDEEENNHIEGDADAEESRMDEQAAIQQEALNNGPGQVMEQPGEEDSQGYDETQGDMTNHDRSLAIGRHDTSLMSAKSAAKNASLLAQNLDTEELEALAMCFDNIR